MKSERCVWSNSLKLVVNETIQRINKKIIHFNEKIQSESLEINNKTTMCEDKYKQTLSGYDIKGEENT